ncbi:MAG: hypothetical protein AB1758_09435, partial [Candidatus Eremiobacterota bacterium]
MMVFALIFILTTLAAVLHHQHMVARQSTMRAEADLQFRVARRYAEAKRLGKTTATPPRDVEFSATPKDVSPSRTVEMAARLGTALWTGLPDVMIAPDSRLPAPGTRDLEIGPSTSNPSMRVFGNNRYRLVEAPWVGYAAYAPKGFIKAREVFGWANPSFEDARKTLEAYNGVPAVLAAEGDIETTHLTYGMAYTRSGAIDLGSQDLNVGFAGFHPLAPYETELANQINAVLTSVQTASSTSEKTMFIRGGIFDVASAVVLFFSGTGQLHVTLEQAMRFPFPPIPGWSQDVAGVLYEFYISLPEPPDFSKADLDPAAQHSNATASKETDALGAEIKQLAEDLKAARQQVTDLEGQLARATKQSEKDAIQKDLDRARNRVTSLENELKDKRAKLLHKSALHKDEIENSFIRPYLPVTRQDDLAFRKQKRGQIGWPYRALLANMLNILLNLITGDLDGIRDAFFRPVRIVHYGRKTNVPDFTFDNNVFHSTSTWTVPPGRTFKYTGNMEIVGDLWLQRGSAFVVDGSLTLADPGTSPANPLSPSGRLFLEEGSTLVVTGDFQCEGSQLFGSVLVGSRPGQVHPITSAILVNGEVNLPYGVFSGAPLPDVVDWLATKVPALGGVNKVLVPFLNDVAPNAAKVIGPFHMRACYFASYAATFKLVVIPGTGAPVP